MTPYAQTLAAPDHADETLDPDDWDELRALGHRMLDDMFGYLASVRTRPAWRPVPEEVKGRLDEPLPLAPTDAARLGYAAYLGSMGRFDEALGEAKKADGLAPSIRTDIVLARLYYSMRRYEEAADYWRRSLKKGDNVLGHFDLGFVHTAQQRYDEAIAEFKTGADFSNNGGALAGLAYGYAMGGKKDEALKIMDELKATYNGSRLVPYRAAAVYLALGDKDQAIEWLKRDYEERGNWMNQLKVDPVMDPLRSEPRF